MAHFSDEHRPLFKPWLDDSNFLVVVAVPNEHALLQLAQDALGRSIKHTLFREPDLDNEATSLALEPGMAAQRLCASLPLALKEKRLAA